MTDIIQVTNIEMAASQKNLSGRVNILFSRSPKELPYSSGASSLMPVVNPASTAPSLETNPRTYRATLSERQTPLLISAGLVRGTTLTFGLRLLNRGIPAGVSYAPDGSVVDILKVTSLF